MKDDAFWSLLVVIGVFTGFALGGIVGEDYVRQNTVPVACALNIDTLIVHRYTRPSGPIKAIQGAPMTQAHVDSFPGLTR